MKSILLFLAFFSPVIVFACPGVGNWNSESKMGPGSMGNMMNHTMGDGSGQGWTGCQMSMIRHHYYMQNGIPSEYANLSKPKMIDEKILTAGKKIYETNCMSCHGQNGQGDGDAGKNLDPRPANIAMFSKMPMATDSYMFWTINDGGVKINTAMPSFKDTLKKEEIWSVITYLRSL